MMFHPALRLGPLTLLPFLLLAICAAASGNATEALAAAERSLASTLLWGSYRPQNYFGFRPRLPESLFFGLAWAPIKADVTHPGQAYAGALQNIRHKCDDRQPVIYKWTRHDGRSFGTEVIEDAEANVRIEASFVKTGGDAPESNGGSWAVRLRGEALDKKRPAQIALFPYFGAESPATSLRFVGADEPSDLDERGFPWDEPIKLTGSGTALGTYDVRIEHPSASDVGAASADGHNQGFASPSFARAAEYAPRQGRTQYMAAQLPYEQVWRVADYVGTTLGVQAKKLIESYEKAATVQGDTPEQRAQAVSRLLPPAANGLQLANQAATVSPNLLVLQDTFDVSGPKGGSFAIDVFFDSHATPAGQCIADSAALTAALDAAAKRHDEQFKAKSALAPPYDSPAGKEAEMAREMVASVFGGVGYFYGKQLVERPASSVSAGGDDDEEDDDDAEDDEWGIGAIDLDDLERQRGPARKVYEGPYALTTGTPGRAIFPRGFYWDEGFHLAVLGAYDADLSLEILRSWFALVDKHGWVPREVALGKEAESRVPEAFLAQNPRIANPPTLTMALAMFIDQLERAGGASAEAQLDDMLGMGQQVAFGAEQSSNTTASGSSRFLADHTLSIAYLRRLYPALRRHYQWFRRTQRGELREWGRTGTAGGGVEAYRWRGRSKDGHVFASGLDDYPRAEEPHSGELHLDLHSWMGFFARTMRRIATVIGEDDDLEEYERHEESIIANLDDLHWSEEHGMYCDATVDANSDESVAVCHGGYVSIFPLLLGLLSPENPRLGKVLEFVRDRKTIWSDYGLLSLSRKDALFETREAYWRGPIWMPINYMALGALKRYSEMDGPYRAQAREAYAALRTNIVGNVHKEYVRTGWTWEQYNATTGRGQRGHPFTGWTSTVALAMAEIY